MNVETAEGVSSHDGHALLAVEAEVLLEEVQRLPTVSHGVSVDLLLGGDVGPGLVARDTVRAARAEWNCCVEEELTARLALEVVALSS